MPIATMKGSNLDPEFSQQRIENRLTAIGANFTSLTVNTSFNVRAQPIVCKPEDVLGCFMRTKIETSSGYRRKPARLARLTNLSA